VTEIEKKKDKKNGLPLPGRKGRNGSCFKHDESGKEDTRLKEDFLRAATNNKNRRGGKGGGRGKSCRIIEEKV